MAANLKIKKIAISHNDVHCVPPKMSPFNFLNNCQKLTNFNDFWYVKSRDSLKRKSYRFVHLTCQMYPLYLGKSKSHSIFNSIIHTCF